MDHFQFSHEPSHSQPLHTSSLNEEPQSSWIPLTDVVGPIEESIRNIFQLGPISIDREKGYLNFPSTSKLSEIFMYYLPPTLLRNIWDSYEVTHWIYGQGKRAGTISKGVFSARLIYTCLAVYIRIIALQNDQKQTAASHQHPSQTAAPNLQTERSGKLSSEKREESPETAPSTSLYNGNLTGRPQRAAICEALTYFRFLLVSHITNNLLENQEASEDINNTTNNQQMISMNAQNEANNKMPGMQAVEIIFSRYHFQRSFWPAICQNFRSALITPGRCLVGDENLLHFTGSSGFIRIVPTKPDKVGLWFFELVCLLSNNTPYLLHAKLFDTNSNQGSNIIPLNTVVEEWGSIVNEFSIKKEGNIPPLNSSSIQQLNLNNSNHNLTLPEATNSTSVRKTVNSDEIREIFSKPILVFDSYYMDEDGRKYLLKSKIPYIATIQPSKFPDLTDHFDRFQLRVNKPGQNALLWNEQTNEIFLHHYDINMNIGQKYLLSNAFYPRELYHSYFHYSTEPIFSDGLSLNYPSSHIPMHHHNQQQSLHQSQHQNFHYPQNLSFNSNIPLQLARPSNPHMIHNQHSSLNLHHHHQQQVLSSQGPLRQSHPSQIQHQHQAMFHQTSHHHHITYPSSHNNSISHLPQQSPVSPTAISHKKAMTTASVIQAVFEATTQIENPSVEYTYIPQQDLFNVYKDIFQTCDLYNQQIHSYKYCHKSGGCHKSGEDGICHKFLMACVLQNTIVAYRSVREKENSEIQNKEESFQELCLRLSDELFLKAMEM